MLDAEIYYLVTIVGEDDVNEVLADVVYISLYGSQHHRAFVHALKTVHERLQKFHSRLHRFRRLKNERELHLAAAEKVSDRFHSIEKNVVDDLERGVFFESSLECILEPDLFAVDDVPFKFLFDRKVRNIRLDRLRRFALEKFCEFGQWIVNTNVAFESATIVNKILGNFDLVFAEAVQRKDL